MFNSENAKKAQQASVEARRSRKNQKNSLESFLETYFSNAKTHSEIEKALSKVSKNNSRQYLDLINKLLAFVTPRKTQVTDTKSAFDVIRNFPLSEDEILRALQILTQRLEDEHGYIYEK